MAVVLTTFTTSNGTIVPSEFRSVTPKRCKLVTVDLSEELRERYEVEQLEMEFPFGPRNMQFGAQATIMDQIQRPGKKPLLQKRNDPLRTVTFNAVIASTANAAGGRRDVMSGTTPVDAAMETLERIAQSGSACKFVYGTVQLGYFVALTKFDFTVKYRDAEGHPVRVDAQFQLTEKPVFEQELTNLPVIPNDPPEQDPPKGVNPPPAPWLVPITQYGSEKLDDFFGDRDGKTGLIGEYDASGEPIPFNVYETLGFNRMFNSQPAFKNSPLGFLTG